MVFLPLLLWLPCATANPVAGGAQVAVFPSGVDMVTSWFGGRTFHVDKARVGGEYDCWDELGIQQFNLDIPVDSVQVDLRGGYLDVLVDFGTISGQDMLVYGLDADYLDLCPEFDSELKYLVMLNPAYEVSLAPRVERGELVLDVIGTPSLTGDLDMDIDWVPDDLVLAFYEDSIFEQISEASAEYIPEMVAGAFDSDMLSGTLLDFTVTAAPVDAGVSSQSLTVGADLETRWNGDSSCDSGGSGSGGGQQPDLDFGDGEGSTLALGVTEYQLNASVRQLRSDGYFCFDDDRMTAVYELVAELFDPAVGGIEASASMEGEPTFDVGASGIEALFPSLELDVRGTKDGREVDLLSMRADLSATIDVGVASSLTAITLTLHDLVLDMRSLEADHLLSDSPSAERNLESFLETWVAGWVEDQLQGMALFSAQYYTLGYYIRVDRMEYEPGGLEIYLSLYDSDDPAVDKQAPNTIVQIQSQTRTGATFAWLGTDDRQGPLAFSWQVDGQGWSGWTHDASHTCDDLLPGSHIFDVKARDSWLNEDPTPARSEFALTAAPAGDDEKRGCGCATGASQVGWLGLLVAGLAGRRRRTR